MSKYGRTIRIYLADGTATGIRHAELVNWTGQAIVCPRGRIGELSKWKESQRPGVYLLFGEDATGSKPMAYVGEAEHVHERLKTHVKNKDFWDQVVFFTNKDENLTKAHVKYLEARMIQIAGEAGRVALENGTAPQLPSLPRADQDAMEEFLDPARILLAALGFLLLQPVPTKASQAGASEGGPSGPLSAIRLYCKVQKSGADAEGASTDEGFVVYAGSRGPRKILDSLSKGWRAMREDLEAQGAIVGDDKTVEFAKDVLFTSPSAAASIVCGGVRNGRKSWRDVTGKALHQLEEELTVGAPDNGEPATP